MTAQIFDLFPTGEQADDTVRRTVDALIRGKGLRREDVAQLAGMSRSAFFRKMAGKGSEQAFRAGEVASIARVLGVHVSQLYDGLGGTFVPPEPPDHTPGGDQRTSVGVSASERQRRLDELAASKRQRGVSTDGYPLAA